MCSILLFTEVVIVGKFSQRANFLYLRNTLTPRLFGAGLHGTDHVAFRQAVTQDVRTLCVQLTVMLVYYVVAMM